MTHAFAANAAVLDTSEWIIVQAEACGFVDPECADVEIVGKSQDSAEVPREDRSLNLLVQKVAPAIAAANAIGSSRLPPARGQL